MDWTRTWFEMFRIVDLNLVRETEYTIRWNGTKRNETKRNNFENKIGKRTEKLPQIIVQKTNLPEFNVLKRIPEKKKCVAPNDILCEFEYMQILCTQKILFQKIARKNKENELSSNLNTKNGKCCDV